MPYLQKASANHMDSHILPAGGIWSISGLRQTFGFKDFYEFGGLKGERKFLVCKWKKGNGVSGGIQPAEIFLCKGAGNRVRRAYKEI